MIAVLQSLFAGPRITKLLHAHGHKGALVWTLTQRPLLIQTTRHTETLQRAI